MITASFDVRGANLDELIESGRTIANQLVGPRDYTYDMDISAGVMVAGEIAPVRWVAEFRLRVKEST
jgi:hypothetical protein